MNTLKLGLVFSKLDKNVIGKQNEDGTIIELTKNDIELCNKFKFKYILPENLNEKLKKMMKIRF